MPACERCFLEERPSFDDNPHVTRIVLSLALLASSYGCGTCEAAPTEIEADGYSYSRVSCEGSCCTYRRHVCAGAVCVQYDRNACQTSCDPWALTDEPETQAGFYPNPNAACTSPPETHPDTGDTLAQCNGEPTIKGTCCEYRSDDDLCLPVLCQNDCAVWTTPAGETFCGDGVCGPGDLYDGTACVDSALNYSTCCQCLVNNDIEGDSCYPEMEACMEATSHRYLPARDECVPAACEPACWFLR